MIDVQTLTNDHYLLWVNDISQLPFKLLVPLQEAFEKTFVEDVPINYN
jgi:hypothetical protein